MKQNLKNFIIFSMCLLGSINLCAQEHTPFKVRGKISDKNGENLVGVTVTEKGGTNGTISNEKGEYDIAVSDANATLVFSYLGYSSLSQKIDKKSIINIHLSDDQKLLDEVVVTALGVSREKKALGYSVQDVKGSLLDDHVSNFASALSGKVAGVSISTNATVGSTSRVVIRGESSLNYQANQPLYVVDGVPVGNDAVQNETNADFGNSSAEFNPLDVESISVLKGAAASALYGSRAANGVIMITTKSGKGQKGLGISYSGSFSRETPLRLPKMQNQFGQGQDGQYEGSNFGYSNNGLYPDGINDAQDESWGPRFDGKPRVQFDSPTSNGYRAADVYLSDRGTPIATPWVAHPDNMKTFFSSGHTNVNSLSISNSDKKGSFRLSFTNLNQAGLTPNNNLKRNTFNFNGTYTINPWIKATVTGSYINSKSTNRPSLGYNDSTPGYFFVWLPQNHNINSYKNYWIPGMEGIQQFEGDYGDGHTSPYLWAYENTSGQNKDHFFENAKLDIKLTPKLKLMGRVGSDYYNDFRPRQMVFSTTNHPEGYYQETRLKFQENNLDALLSYTNQLSNNLGLVANLGTSYMDRTQNTSINTAQALIIPDLFSLSNSKEKPDVSSYGYHKQTQSVYGSVEFDYKHMLFMDITGRNDWSSTLPTNNNSYFYPSLTASVLISQMIKMPKAISFLKIRTAYAQVGNDTDPYNLRTVYTTNGFFGSSALISEESSLKNKNLKPEQISSTEGGLEFGLFGNRLHGDITLYQSDSKDQIMNLQTTPTSGYTSEVVNGGHIRNRGIEIVLQGTPISISDGLKWNITVNFAKNKGTVISLADGINNLVISAPGEDAKMVAGVGDRMGELWGPGFQRVKDGPMKGQIIIGSNGLPLITADPIRLGNVNPDWTGGINNEFSYKNIVFSFLVDIHSGGVFVSHLLNKGAGAGQLIESEKGRGARAVGHEYDDPYYMDGAAQLADGTYTQNSTIQDGTYSQGIYGTDARSFIKNYYDHNSEAQLVSASYAKLREFKLGYNLPISFVKKLKMQNINISAFGRDLFLWTPKSNLHSDPETAVSNTGNGLVLGFEDLSIPSSRSVGIQVNLKF